MSKLMIEISESEYLIKLQKGEFDLSQVRAILAQIMSLPYWENTDGQPGFANMRSAELADRFDHLSDK